MAATEERRQHKIERFVLAENDLFQLRPDRSYVFVERQAVNLRMAPMGAALAPVLDRLRGWRLWATLAVLVDNAFALSVAEMRAGRRDPGFLLGASLTMLANWLLTCAIGHSLGALVGYELTWRRWRNGGVLPVHLVLSGHGTPWAPRRRPPIAGLSEPEFVSALAELGGIPDAVLADRELMSLVLPGLRADVRMSEEYLPPVRAALPVPILALTGDADPDVTPEDAARADEVFITSSLRDVQAVRAWDGVVREAPGPQTALLAKIFAERALDDLDP